MPPQHHLTSFSFILSFLSTHARRCSSPHCPPPLWPSRSPRRPSPVPPCPQSITPSSPPLNRRPSPGWRLLTLACASVHVAERLRAPQSAQELRRRNVSELHGLRRSSDGATDPCAPATGAAVLHANSTASCGSLGGGLRGSAREPRRRAQRPRAGAPAAGAAVLHVSSTAPHGSSGGRRSGPVRALATGSSSAAGEAAPHELRRRTRAPRRAQRPSTCAPQPARWLRRWRTSEWMELGVHVEREEGEGREKATVAVTAYMVV